MSYIQVVEGEWLAWNKKERRMCCDCHLVHSVEYRQKKGDLEVRMYRDNRATAANRRVNKITVKKKAK